MNQLDAAVFAITAALLCATPSAYAGTVEGTVSHPRGKAYVVVSIEVPGAPVVIPAKPPVVNQREISFDPHVLAITVGTTVEFHNSDPINHNVFSPDVEGYNLGTWGRGVTRTRVFPQVGVYTQLCTLHPEMESFIVVLDTPYFAVSDASGRFVVPGVPDGRWVARAWGARFSKAERLRAYFVDVVDGAGSLVIDLGS